MSFRIGFNRYNTVDFANSYGIEKNNEPGNPERKYPWSAYTSGIAQFNVPGYGYSGAPGLTGDPGYTNAKRVANIYEFTDSSLGSGESRR